MKKLAYDLIRVTRHFLTINAFIHIFPYEIPIYFLFLFFLFLHLSKYLKSILLNRNVIGATRSFNVKL